MSECEDLCEHTDHAPLSSTWKLWFNTKARGSSYCGDPSIIGGWACAFKMWHWLLPKELQPGELPLGTGLYIFKSGIAPSWEDPMNANGGRWTISMTSGSDALWPLICMGVAGLTLGPSITGIIVLKRKNYTRISVWTTSKTDDDTNLEIGTTLKKYMTEAGVVMRVLNQRKPLTKVPPLEYQDHGADYDKFRHVL